MPGIRHLSKLDELGDSVRQVIKAYHGSPYDFDKFDARKIGTGEGAQSYSHGHYFAGREGVAKFYRDSLKDMVDLPVPDELVDELQAAIKEIRGLAERRGALSGPIDFHGAKTPSADEWYAIQKQLDDAHSRHEDIQHRYRDAAQNPGRMYEVEIAHPESALLDWDAPLSGQSRAVRERLAPLRSDKYDLNPRDGTDVESGATALARIAGVEGELGAAAALHRAGIPGVRYLDAGSRGFIPPGFPGWNTIRDPSQATRNYVMFPGTEDSIRILRKYGMMAPIAAGAAAGTQGPINREQERTY